MKKLLLTLLLLSSLSFGIAQPAFIGVHASDDQFGPVRAFIQKQMLERQVPSVAVAVARDGKIIWEEAFG